MPDHEQHGREAERHDAAEPVGPAEAIDARLRVLVHLLARQAAREHLTASNQTKDPTDGSED